MGRAALNFFACWCSCPIPPLIILAVFTLRLRHPALRDSGRAYRVADPAADPGPEQGRIVSIDDPLGNPSAGSSGQAITTYAYNGLRQVTTVTDPRGKITRNAYDTRGNLLSTTDPLGNVTGYTYFPSGLPQTVTNAAGKVTQFVSDGNGNLTQQTDALGNVTTFAYDATNRKLSQTVTRTKADGTTENLTTKQSGFIPPHQLITITDPRGVVVLTNRIPPTRLLYPIDPHVAARFTLTN